MVWPSKFALSFTLGSVCSMSVFAMLKGPTVYITRLLQPTRLPLISTYFVTLGKIREWMNQRMNECKSNGRKSQGGFSYCGCTLYRCLVLEDYAFVVISSVMQLMTLRSFALSASPVGNVSLKGEKSKSLSKIYVTEFLFMVANVAVS